MKYTTADSRPRLGIMISMFPELHETFILRELVALQRAGLDFDIYSLQFPRDPITLDDAIQLSHERTTYAPLFSVRSLMALFKMAVAHPIRLTKTVGKVIWLGRDRPSDVLKNLAILPVALHFGEIGARRGTTHWHGHWANIPTTACWYLQQLRGQTWSAAIHGEDIFSANRFLQHKLDAAVFSVVCSGYFCRHLQTELGLSRPENVHLNYHGLDPRVMDRTTHQQHRENRYKKYPESEQSFDAPVKLISIGRLVPTKGHDVLIRACSILKHKFDLSFQLHLIGSGPEQANLAALVKEEDVAAEVVFTGGLAFEEVLASLEQADVFCLAPRLLPGQPPDGIPNVIAEAMALRVPVVCTRVSAIPELVENGVTGRLTEVDDAEAMAQALFDVASDQAVAQELSTNAHAKVSSMFDQHKNITELLDYFRRYVPGKVLP